MANEYHWRAEPGKIAERPLMDCSNAQPGIIPLNTETTKQMGIARYQTVVLPNLREVVTSWDEYRRANAIEWSDMWMFKADISNCFNQLHQVQGCRLPYYPRLVVGPFLRSKNQNPTPPN